MKSNSTRKEEGQIKYSSHASNKQNNHYHLAVLYTHAQKIHTLIFQILGMQLLLMPWPL